LQKSDRQLLSLLPVTFVIFGIGFRLGFKSLVRLMGKRGLEPLRLAAIDPKSIASASSATSPKNALRLQNQG
jgi:hypothetical protein